jgi:hypothetical protein
MKDPSLAHKMAHNTPGFKKGALKDKNLPDHTTTVAQRHKTAKSSAKSTAKSRSNGSTRGKSTAPAHVPSKSIYRSHAAGKAMAKRARSK